MSRELVLTGGLVTVVDDEDFDELSRHRWQGKRRPRNRSYYAVRSKRLPGRKQRFLQMHRVILRAPDGVLVDHIDGNGLNNQKANLRLVTSSQNSQNRTRKTAGCDAAVAEIQRRMDRRMAVL